MLACGILTLVLVPALLPHRGPSRPIPALVLPALARWIASRRRTILIIAALATVLLALAATRMRINPTLDRLRSVTDAALLEQRIAPMFGLPREVYVVTADGPDLEALLESNERLVHRVEAALPDVRIHAPTLLLPSNAAQEHRATEIRRSGLEPASVRAALDEAGDAEGFKRGSFAPFAERLPRLLNATERLTYEGYTTHGLSDLLARFVVRDAGRWRIATYAYPTTPAQLDTFQQIVDSTDRQMTLTGLPLVNRELADRFVPQFLKGLAIGTVIVVVLVVLAFRNWRLSVYSLLPTAVGLVWAAGLLAMAGVELDLFALFAVVTFVGIGVDYGIHLVHRFQERGDAERAVGELAPVILTAAAITMLGYGTLLGSSYPPLRSIGLVSAVSVVALAVSSVLVLPALLMGRGK
jgi:predicted RND superfamily exporter protein